MRDPMQSKAKIGQAVMFALVTASIFHNTGINNQGDLEGKIDPSTSMFNQKQQLFTAAMEMFGGLYFMAMNAFMGNFFNAILLFQAERPVFLRE